MNGTGNKWKNLIKICGILLAIIIIPQILVYSAHLINCQSFTEVFSRIGSMWGVYLIESVMLGILVLFVYGIFSRLYVANLVVAVPYMLMTLISYYKAVINGTPLLLGDFRMAGQFFEIAQFAIPQVEFSVYTYVALAIPLVVTAVLFLLDRLVRAPKFVILPLSAVLLIISVITPIFSNWAVSLDDADKFQEQRVTEYGPFMGMYCTYAQGKKAGEIYTQDAVLRVKNQTSAVSPAMAEETKTPTVIFLMSESFFDVGKLDNVKFSPDPIPNFHRLRKNYQSGEFISSAYCGGTGYVEMEVMTGICSNLLKAGDTLSHLSQRDVYKRMPAITDVFKNYGYKTVFLHSYNSELYNRDEIYDDFGFDEVLFEDSFREPEFTGGYISDISLADKIISMHKEKGDKPLFLYAVSMENHQPYVKDKFEKNPVKVKTNRLNEDEKAVLDAYITGVYDADKMLGKLIRYFGKQKEPVMIVFFGDHMPNLSLEGGENVFTKLGYIGNADTSTWNSGELTKMLSTDYVIWTNYRDADYVNSLQSSNFLGVSVLERLGFNLTDYYLWLSERVMPNMLMYRSRLFLDEAGNYFGVIPDNRRSVIDDYSVAIYDIIYGNDEIFNTKHQKEKNYEIFDCIRYSRLGALLQDAQGAIR